MIFFVNGTELKCPPKYKSCTCRTVSSSWAKPPLVLLLPPLYLASSPHPTTLPAGFLSEPRLSHLSPPPTSVSGLPTMRPGPNGQWPSWHSISSLAAQGCAHQVLLAPGYEPPHPGINRQGLPSLELRALSPLARPTIGSGCWTTILAPPGLTSQEAQVSSFPTIGFHSPGRSKLPNQWDSLVLTKGLLTGETVTSFSC